PHFLVTHFLANRVSAAGMSSFRLSDVAQWPEGSWECARWCGGSGTRWSAGRGGRPEAAGRRDRGRSVQSLRFRAADRWRGGLAPDGAQSGARLFLQSHSPSTWCDRSRKRIARPFPLLAQKTCEKWGTLVESLRRSE